jgi:hypothetical protein
MARSIDSALTFQLKVRDILRIGIPIIFVILFGLADCPALRAQTNQFWPAVNYYQHINEYSRFYFQIQDTRENQTGLYLLFGHYMFFYLKPKFGLG